MLWNKSKPTEPSRVAAAAPAPNASSFRVAEADRALTVIGTLLETYGRFAFDAAEPAARLRERCSEWAQRLTLGESPSSATSANAASAGVKRDFRGAERFFEDMRQGEVDFVKQTLSGLRSAVLSLARSLGQNVGEDQSSDAKLEHRLGELQGALEQGDVRAISRAASTVIETSRNAIVQRRERETRQAQKLDKELRLLREQLSGDLDAAGNDTLTGLFGRAQYEQQLDQITAIGSLLTEPPWQLLIVVSAGKRDKPSKTVPDKTLREVGNCISRTFLRRQDFAARTGPHELAVLIVDMTQPEVIKAVERLIGVVHAATRPWPSNETPHLSVGIVRLRANEDPARWRTRAEAALERAREEPLGYFLGVG